MGIWQIARDTGIRQIIVLTIQRIGGYDFMSLLIAETQDALSTLDATRAMQFDPSYQNNLLLIEDAMRQTGLLDTPAVSHPDILDTELRHLIDSVPMD